MSVGLQHALIGALVAATAYLQWMRARSVRRDEEERQQRLADAAKRSSDA